MPASSISPDFTVVDISGAQDWMATQVGPRDAWRM